MSNTIVGLNNGQMTGILSSYMEENKLPSIQYFKANGWVGNVTSKGTIEFLCEREYSDGTHSIKGTIFHNGCLKVTLKVNNEKPKVIYKKRLAKTIKEVDGEIILGGGRVEDRFVSFRTREKIEFLRRHHISSFRYGDPNKEFSYMDKVCTDGTVEKTPNPLREYYPNLDVPDIILYDKVTVRDASYVFIKRYGKTVAGDTVAYTTLVSQLSMEELDELLKNRPSWE